MRTINEIIIHCSMSYYGSVEVIGKWHVAKGFDKVGYHFIIQNGYPTYESWKKGVPEPENEGYIEEGRDLSEIGAHCKGHNDNSIGVCLIGNKTFTTTQLKALRAMVDHLSEMYNIKRITLHNEYEGRKTCPNIDKAWLMKFLAEKEVAE